jgi:hypothetical protein
LQHAIRDHQGVVIDPTLEARMAHEILRIHVDGDTLEALRVRATAERRPLNWQAEVMLRRALGLPFPAPMSAIDDAAVKHKDACEVVHAAR